MPSHAAPTTSLIGSWRCSYSSRWHELIGLADPAVALEILNLRTLAADNALRDELARLVLTSFDLYGAVPVSAANRVHLIGEELLTDASECADGWCALVDGRPVGVICCYPVNELAVRQRTSLLSLMRGLTGEQRSMFRRSLFKRGYSVEPIIRDNGLYISRVGVHSSYRGGGIGRRLIDRAVAEFGAKEVFLHVDKNNLTAIGFYISLNFQFFGSNNARKVVMHRSGSVIGK
jgi:ribosomal protein S18 acetylase RimI-like enzyme